MIRRPEKELMTGLNQVRAYALADFDDAHSMYMKHAEEHIGRDKKRRALDLGCGAGDITRRFAQRYPDCKIDALDGSKEMLHWARKLTPHPLQSQIRWIYKQIPAPALDASYDTIISNSLLHHLPDPMTLWKTIKTNSRKNTRIFIMDLVRPKTYTKARYIVKKYAEKEPSILQEDFYRSLLAAYRPEEIEAQLSGIGLHHLSIRTASDRHLMVSGEINH